MLHKQNCIPDVGSFLVQMMVQFSMHKSTSPTSFFDLRSDWFIVVVFVCDDLATWESTLVRLCISAAGFLFFFTIGPEPTIFSA
jgi:hypothetical protein